jgi:hypothetical protein
LAHIQAEEQKRLAAEREAILAARRTATTAGRRENRPKEIAELRELLLQNRNDLSAHKEANAQTEEWNTYLACRTVPEPSDLRGINGYLSIWSDVELDGTANIEAALEKCEEASTLAKSIDGLAETQDDAGEHGGAVISRGKSQEVREMLLKKLDEITANMQQYADRFTPDEMSDLTYSHKLEDLRMFLWCNLTNDPATIEVAFKTPEELLDEEKAFAIKKQLAEEAAEKKKKKGHSKDEPEAPEEPEPQYPKVSISKGLTMNNISLRVVQLSANPFTPDTRLVAISDTNPEDDFGGEEPEPEVVEKEEGEEGEDGEKKGEEEAEKQEESSAADAAVAATGGAAAEGAVDGAAPAAEGAVAPAEGAEGAPLDPAAAAGADGEAATDPAAAAVLEAVVEAKVVRELRPGEVNLDKFMPVGDVFLMDLFDLVEPAVTRRKWKIRVLSDHTETPPRQPYPLNGAPRVPVPDKEGETMEARAGVAPWEALEVEMSNYAGCVTDGVIDEKDATPSLAWWDTSRKAWFTDGFDEVTLNRTTNLLKFSTKRLAPITLVQKRARFVPLHDWEVQQSDADPSLISLSLVGNKHTTQINFNKDGKVCMAEPKLPELSAIVGQWFEPRLFIQTLVRAGFNVFPALQQRDENGDVMNPPHDNKVHFEPKVGKERDFEKEAALTAAAEAGDADALAQVAANEAAEKAEKEAEELAAKSPVIKDYDTEVQVYKQISLLCNTFCFRESVWNHRLPGMDFALRVIEQDKDGVELDGADWRIIYVNGTNACYEVQSREYDDAFSPEITENPAINAHSTLYHAVKSGGTEAGKTHTNDVTPAQSAALLRVLCAVRPLHFSTALGSKAFQDSERKRVAEEAEAARIAAEEAAAAEEYRLAQEAAAAEAAAIEAAKPQPA